MKKVKSYSLSPEAIAEVIRIKKLKGYKSDSDALEAIIMHRETDEEKLKRLIHEILKGYQVSITATKEELTQEEQDAVEQQLLNSMEDIYGDLK